MSDPVGHDLWTSYSFDLMNHMTGLYTKMYSGPYVTQARSFKYNNTGYLQSETDQESETGTYT